RERIACRRCEPWEIPWAGPAFLLRALRLGPSGFARSTVCPGRARVLHRSCTSITTSGVPCIYALPDRDKVARITESFAHHVALQSPAAQQAEGHCRPARGSQVERS